MRFKRKTRLERDQHTLNEARKYLLPLAEWHRVFAILPVRMEGCIVWLEDVERRIDAHDILKEYLAPNVNNSDYANYAWMIYSKAKWEYRLPPKPAEGPW